MGFRGGFRSEILTKRGFQKGVIYPKPHASISHTAGSIFLDYGLLADGRGRGVGWLGGGLGVAGGGSILSITIQIYLSNPILPSVE